MDDFELPRIPIGDTVNSFVREVLLEYFGWLFTGIRDFLVFQYDLLADLLYLPPSLVFILLIGALAYFVRGWAFALFTVIAFGIIDSMDLWAPTMETLALIIVVAVYAALIGIPLGILAAKNKGFSTAVRPVLDFMQTLPVFVYMIPAVLLFSAGTGSAVIAALIFALPPSVRLTELGIRHVDGEVVEAAEAFGAVPAATLRRVQIPLALPSIMQGVNQLIMLALSMVVVAGLVGGPGLGNDVVRAMSRADLSGGFEAGLAVVFIAVFLDRMTGSFGRGGPGGGAAKRKAEKLAEMARKPAMDPAP